MNGSRCKILLFIVFCGVLMFFAGDFNSRAIEEYDKVESEMGVLLTPKEEYEKFPETQYPAGGALPSKVDLSEDFPPPGDQGTQLSCVAWSVGYAYKGYQERKERGWNQTSPEHQFSPAYIFNQLTTGENRGIYVSQAIDLLCRQGVCTLSSMPYDANDWNSFPSKEQRKEAATFRGTGFSTIKGDWMTVITKIKTKLYEGYPVVLVFHETDDFKNLTEDNPVYDVHERTGSYHCVVITGYDDSLNAFKLINSYGIQWGISGFGYISYDMFDNDTIQELYVIEDAGFRGRFPYKKYFRSQFGERILDSDETEAAVQVKSAWVKDINNYFYFNSKGYQHLDWLYYGQKWYYLNPDATKASIGEQGAMCTGWIRDRNQWYFLRTADNKPTEGGLIGSMCIGWIYDRGYWYYLREGKDFPTKGPLGSMCTGWITLQDGTYFLRTALNFPNKGDWGSMVKGATVIIDNKTYTFDTSGRCVNPPR